MPSPAAARHVPVRRAFRGGRTCPPAGAALRRPPSGAATCSGCRTRRARVVTTTARRSSGTQAGTAQARGDVVPADDATGVAQALRRRLDRRHDGADAGVAAVVEAR